MQNSGKTTVNWALTMACWSAIGSGCLLSGIACNKMESAARQADRVGRGVGVVVKERFPSRSKVLGQAPAIATA